MSFQSITVGKIHAWIFLDKCAKYAQISREFCANFVGLCVDLNPFCAFPRVTREREPSNFRGDCTVPTTFMFSLRYKKNILSELQKRVDVHIIFFLFLNRNMLWVFIRSASLRCF